jgi:peptide/nickel transport system permease protein
MALSRTTETAPEVAGPGGGVAAPTAPFMVRRTRRVGALRWLSLLVRNRKAAIGLVILAFFLALAIVGPLIWSGDPNAADYSIAPMQPPSPAHPLGTDHLNHDIFLQMVDGAWPSLELGFAIGLCATALAVLIGMSAGYFSGWIDEVLSLVINIVLIIPSLPLIIVLASWIRVRNDLPIILVISLTGWAAGARVLRSQTLSLRQKEFVQAAVVRGEPGLRIVLREILPNMTSLVVSNFIGTTVFAIGSAAGLVFLGLGNISEVSWFSILYQAQNASALQDGAWWNFVPPGLAIALVGTALALVNYGIDEISNPRLRSERVKAPRRASVPAPAPAARKVAAR